VWWDACSLQLFQEVQSFAGFGYTGIDIDGQGHWERKCKIVFRANLLQSEMFYLKPRPHNIFVFISPAKILRFCDILSVCLAVTYVLYLSFTQY